MIRNEALVRRRAEVCQFGKLAGCLEELPDGSWRFAYLHGYAGMPVSLTLPVRCEPYHFKKFPSIFDGLLPEGLQLEALLRKHKIDRNDCFRQLMLVGEDMVGSLTVREVDAPDEHERRVGDA